MKPVTLLTGFLLPALLISCSDAPIEPLKTSDLAVDIVITASRSLAVMVARRRLLISPFVGK